MPSGKIVKVDDKGYGFIQPDEEGKRDMFFHVSGMQNRAEFDSLNVGDRVQYDIDNSQDRPRGIDVEITSRAEPA